MKEWMQFVVLMLSWIIMATVSTAVTGDASPAPRIKGNVGQTNLKLPCIDGRNDSVVATNTSFNFADVSLVKWTRNGEGVFVYFTTSGEFAWGTDYKGRFTFDSGTLELTLVEARPGDEGQYVCEISRDDLGIAVQEFELKVVSPPASLLLTTDRTTIDEGQLLHVTCSVSGVYPAATWQNIVLQHNMLTSGSNVTVQPTPGGSPGLVDITLDATLITQRENNGQKIVCSLSGDPVDPVSFNQSTPGINITFPPTVLYFSPTSTNLAHHDRINLECTSDLSNPPAEITWSAQGNLLHEDITLNHMSEGPYGSFRSRSDWSEEATNQHDGLVITCEAYWMGQRVQTTSVMLRVTPGGLDDDTTNIAFAPQTSDDSDGDICMSRILALGLVLGLTTTVSLTLAAYFFVRFHRIRKGERSFNLTG